MIRPLGDRVVVRPIDPLTVTRSGIILPDVAQEKHHRGVVLAVGPGARAEMTGRFTAPDVEIGDEVLYSKYGGTEVDLGGEQLLVVRCDDLIGVLEADVPRVLSPEELEDGLALLEEA